MTPARWASCWGIIPESFVGAFAKGDILPVLLLAVMFGFALFKLGEDGKPVLDLVDRVGKVIFGIVGIIMRAAPVGAFGAMAMWWPSSASAACGTDLPPDHLYVTCILFVLVVFGAIGRWAGFQHHRLRALHQGRAAAGARHLLLRIRLPRLMAKLENLGCEKSWSASSCRPATL